MSSTLREAASGFLARLEEQLQDFALEAAGYQVRTYFDTADVRDAALGMLAFFTPGEGFGRLIHHFHTPQALVRSLAAGGWVGDFGLLPPHQAEFVGLLKYGFDVGVRTDLDRLTTEFLVKVGIGTPDPDGTLSVERMTEEQLREFTHRQAGEAARFFKAVQCISGGWHRRLKSWREKGRLRIAPSEVDYAKIITSEEFDRVKAALDELRPDRTLNNFADAAAITSLIALLDQAKTRPAATIPRFYVSSEVFRSAIEKSGIAPRLQAEVGGTPVTVLRDDDYFIFKATYAPQHPAVRRDPGEARAELAELAAKMRNLLQLLDTSDGSREEGELPVDMKELEIIENMKRFPFLEKVWLPTLGEHDLKRRLEDLDSSMREMQKPEFRQAVENEARAIRKQFDDYSQREYELAVALRNGLDRRLDHLHARVPDSALHGLDTFLHFGLLRFSFPEDLHEEIRHCLDSLLARGEEARRQIRNRLISLYYAADREPGVLRDLVVAATALWVAGMHKNLVELLKDPERRQALCLRLIFAAAALEQNDTLPLARDEIGSLERRYAEASDPEECARLGVGLAYLQFHLWKSYRMKPVWRLPPHVREGFEKAKYIPLRYAIQYAREAFDTLDRLCHGRGEDVVPPAVEVSLARLRVYAQHQVLYYLVEGEESLEPLRAAAAALIEEKQVPEYWQYRYDDTLARYYFRRAVTERRTELRAKLLEAANRASDQSWQAAHGDWEVEVFRQELENYTLDAASHLGAAEAELAEPLATV
ncbi:MAG TPA: hypothetical protein VF746_31200 [Longimicrobium sp.]|jgi:hypothetical protein